MQLVNKLLDYSCGLVVFFMIIFGAIPICLLLLSGLVAGGYFTVKLAYDILYFTFGFIIN